MSYIESLDLHIDHTLQHDSFVVKEISKGKDKEKLVGADIASMRLVANSDLKNMRIYPNVNLYYIYDKRKGYYRKFSQKDVRICIVRIFKEVNLLYLGGRDIRYLDLVCRNLEGDEDLFRPGTPCFTKGYLVLTNGVLNLNNLDLEPWNAEYFLPSSLPFPYKPDASPHRFFEFLEGVTEGFEDRKEFLRSFLYATIHQRVDLQVFLYLYGKGGTGKSTLALIASALIGDEGVYSTSLKALNGDQFEVVNLIGKKLILINDSEKYSEDLGILRAYVGGDTLRGRVMYTQGTVSVRGEGMIWITSNSSLRTRDRGEAIWRRVRPFKTSRVSRSRKTLFTFVEGQPSGVLADELPGILNWILGSTPESLEKYIVRFEENVLSLQEAIVETKTLLSPLHQWFKEEIIEGEGAYIGYKLNQRDPKGERNWTLRRTLYPAYTSWAERNGIQPLGHHNFSSNLLEVCQSEGVSGNKVRREAGYYIEGISLNPKVFNKDYQFGSTIDIQPEEIQTPCYSTDGLHTNESTACTRDQIRDRSDRAKGHVGDASHQVETNNLDLQVPRRDIPHPRLKVRLYEDYMALLKEKTTLKRDLNNLSRSLSLDICDKLAFDLLKEKKLHSDEYKEGLIRTIKRGVQNLKSFGGIPYSYKTMGTSPRILPVSYGDSINSAKRVVREYVYTLMGKELLEKGYQIVDLDLKSCYTSILLGLYPQETRRLQFAIEKVGLWKYIQEEFKRNGRGDRYNKAAVKICVYSSFFMGGNRAMQQGILDSFRKDVGLSKKEFLRSEFFEQADKIAKDVTYEMQNSEIISDFRDISAYIKKAYMEDYLQGPTGHSYLVSEESFKTAYPNYLQSFEFALLAQASLETVERFPKVEIIGHFHDGNVIAFPKENYEEILEFIQGRVTQIGDDLGLRYPQSLEVKKIYL